MKKKTLVLFILVCTMVSGLFSGCSSGSTSQSNLICLLSTEGVYVIEADGSNLRKVSDDIIGAVFFVGNHIYYRNNFDDEKKLYRIKTDGKDKRELTDRIGGYSINGSRIYFTSAEDGNKLYSMKTDGSDKRKITDESVFLFQLKDDRIYFSNSRETGKLISIKMDGGDRQSLYDGMVGAFCLEGDYIYFSDDFRSGKLHRIKTNGSDLRKLSDDWINPSFQLSGDRIYYTYGGGTSIANCLFSIKTDGSDRKQLTGRMINDGRFYVSGNFIYYTSNSEHYTSTLDGCLYRMHTDGGHEQVLIDGQIGAFSVLNDYIFYMNYSEDGKPEYSAQQPYLYRINTDGSDKKQLTDIVVYSIIGQQKGLLEK